MPLNKIGKLGEDIAERFLKSKGFEILAKNLNLEINYEEVVNKLINKND